MFYLKGGEKVNIGSLQMNSDPMLMMQTQEPNENVTSNNFLSLWQGMNGDQQGDESQKAVPTSMTDQLQSILDCLTGNETNAVNNGDGSITLSNADKQMLSKLLKEIGSLTNKTNVSTQKKMLETKNALENGDDITALVNLVQLIGQMPVEDLQKLDKSSLQKLFQQANAVQNQETSSVQAGIQLLKMSETKDVLIVKIKKALTQLNTGNEGEKASSKLFNEPYTTCEAVAKYLRNYGQENTETKILSSAVNMNVILNKVIDQLKNFVGNADVSSKQKLAESMLALKSGDIQEATVKVLDVLNDTPSKLLLSIGNTKDSQEIKGQQNQLTLNLLKTDGILKNAYARAVENVKKTSQISVDNHQEETANNTVSSMGALMTKTEQYVLHVGGEGKSASYQQFVADFSNILQRANLTKDTGTNKLFIKLNPENLGSLKIELIDQDGVLTAKILTSTSGAKDLLDSQLQQLKQAFAGQNIQLNQVHVIYQESSSQSPPFQQQSSSHEREQQQQQHKDHPEEEMEDDFFDFLLNNLIEMEA